LYIFSYRSIISIIFVDYPAGDAEKIRGESSNDIRDEEK